MAKINKNDEQFLLDDQDIRITVNDRSHYTGYYDPAFSVSYAIENFSKHAVRVASSLMGYYIVPSENLGLEEDISLVITLEIKNKSYLTYKNDIQASTHLDRIIKKFIDLKLDDMKNNVADYHPNRIMFSINLNKVIPDTGSVGFYSELLGLYIDIGGGKEKTFKENIPAGLCSLFEDKQSVIELTDNFYYTATSFIDNNKEYPSLWMMQNGAPVKIKSNVKNGCSSGLYIYNNSTQKNPSVNYKFIPIDRFHDDGVLAAEGYAITKQELLDGLQTQAGVQLKKEKNELEKKSIELTKQYERLVKEKEIIDNDLTSLKKEIKLIKSNHDRVLEQVKYDCNQTVKLSKEQYDRNKEECNRELKRLKEKHEKEISDLSRTYRHNTYDLKEDLNYENKMIRKHESAIKKNVLWLTFVSGALKLLTDLFKLPKTIKQ